jgi:hypothetical protein
MAPHPPKRRENGGGRKIFNDNSELKDEQGNQNWSQPGFLLCKVIHEWEVAERGVVECGKGVGWGDQKRWSKDKNF